MDTITVARVKGGVVVSMEVATPEWVAAQADDPDYTFIPYTEDQPAVIGLKHDPVTGFEQTASGSVTLNADTLTALALTTKQKAVLAAATAPTEPDPVA